MMMQSIKKCIHQNQKLFDSINKTAIYQNKHTARKAACSHEL